MKVIETALPEVKLLEPRRFEDARGFFCETYNERIFAEAGIVCRFVQDNHSLSRRVGTIRGLHFQTAPFAQAKLVRVGRGRIFDVAVDIRRDSPTFRRHVAAELSAANGRQLFIPAGFAHGFCTLEEDTEVLYKASAFYSPQLGAGILWCAPELAIPWPVGPEDAVLSDSDRRRPSLAELSGA